MLRKATGLERQLLKHANKSALYVFVGLKDKG